MIETAINATSGEHNKTKSVNRPTLFSVQPKLFPQIL